MVPKYITCFLSGYQRIHIVDKKINVKLSLVEYSTGNIQNIRKIQNIREKRNSLKCITKEVTKINLDYISINRTNHPTEIFHSDDVVLK